MNMWMGLTIIVMPDRQIPPILRNGPRSMIVTPREVMGLRANDSTIITALLDEREKYEISRAVPA